MGPRFRRALALLPASALLITACVSRPDGPSPADGDDLVSSTAPPSVTTPAEVAGVLDVYRECLAGEGVVIPEIVVDGRGRPMMARAMSGLDLSDPDVLSALSVCAPLLAGVLDTTSDPELEALLRSKLEDFARCVRAEGVADFPDPVRRFRGVGEPFPSSRVPWTDPGLTEAVMVCGERIRSAAD